MSSRKFISTLVIDYGCTVVRPTQHKLIIQRCSSKPIS